MHRNGGSEQREHRIACWEWAWGLRVHSRAHAGASNSEHSYAASLCGQVSRLGMDTMRPIRVRAMVRSKREKKKLVESALAGVEDRTGVEIFVILFFSLARSFSFLFLTLLRSRLLAQSHPPAGHHHPHALAVLCLLGFSSLWLHPIAQPIAYLLSPFCKHPHTSIFFFLGLSLTLFSLARSLALSLSLPVLRCTLRSPTHSEGVTGQHTTDPPAAGTSP
ncbi:unnamed protein product [Mortierella alpina]